MVFPRHSAVQCDSGSGDEPALQEDIHNQFEARLLHEENKWLRNQNIELKENYELEKFQEWIDKSQHTALEEEKLLHLLEQLMLDLTDIKTAYQNETAAGTAASDVSPTPVQDENCPPPDYVPRAVPPRPRVGVWFQPVLDLPYAEAGSDNKEGGTSTEMDVDQDLKGIRPLAPSPPLIDLTAGDTTCSEYTMKLPGNLAAFADISPVASTPGAWSLSRVPQPRHDTDECTVALMPGFFKGSPRATFRQLRQTDEDGDLGAVLPQGHPSAVDEEHQQAHSLEEDGPGVLVSVLDKFPDAITAQPCMKKSNTRNRRTTIGITATDAKKILNPLPVDGATERDARATNQPAAVERDAEANEVGLGGGGAPCRLRRATAKVVSYTEDNRSFKLRRGEV